MFLVWCKNLAGDMAFYPIGNWVTVIVFVQAWAMVWSQAFVSGFLFRYRGRFHMDLFLVKVDQVAIDNLNVGGF